MYQVAKVQSMYWKSIDVKGCEPPEGEELHQNRLLTRLTSGTVTDMNGESPVIPIPGKSILT